MDNFVHSILIKIPSLSQDDHENSSSIMRSTRWFSPVSLSWIIPQNGTLYHDSFGFLPFLFMIMQNVTWAIIYITFRFDSKTTHLTSHQDVVIVEGNTCHRHHICRVLLCPFQMVALLLILQNSIPRKTLCLYLSRFLAFLGRVYDIFHFVHNVVSSLCVEYIRDLLYLLRCKILNSEII